MSSPNPVATTVPALDQRLPKPARRGRAFRQISAAVFLIACAAPAIDLGDTPGGPRGVYRGGAALAFGWLSTFTTVERAQQGRGAPEGGLAGIVADHAWLANVFLLAGWLLYRRNPGAAVAAGLIALSIGVTYLIHPHRGGRLPGAYLWVASHGLFAIGALAACRRVEPPASPPPGDRARPTP